MFFLHPSDTSNVLVEIVESQKGEGTTNEN
jgi:hypothetical protein